MRKFLIVAVFHLLIGTIGAQITSSPIKKEGDGPYSQLILRGVTVINGTGSPAYGPVDLVIEKNKIVQIANIGNPGTPINQSKRPVLKEGGKEINCNDMYIMPGLIDMHGHIGGKEQGTPAE